MNGIDAYYKTVEARINDEVAMKIHVVYYEAVRGDGMTCGSVYKPIACMKTKKRQRQLPTQ